MDTSDLTALVSTLREGLDKIQQILSDLTSAIGATEKRQSEQSQHDTKVSAEIRFPEAIERERSAEQQKQHRTQKAIAVGTWAAFLAASVYASIAAWQLSEMRIATIAARESADAAKSAADTARSTLSNTQTAFEIDQRPYIVSEIPQFAGNGLAQDKPIEANITFRNIGRTPARRYVGNVKLLRFEPGSVTKLRRFLDSSFSILESENTTAKNEAERNGVEEDVAPNGSFFGTNRSDAANATIVSAKDFPKIATGGITLFYLGVVSYGDAFQKPYQTEFCYLYFGSNPQTWHVCDSHNTIK
jgi:hypothetical protein